MLAQTSYALTYGQLREILYDLGFSRTETTEAQIYHQADTDVWLALPFASDQTLVDQAHLTGVRMTLTASGIATAEEFAAMVANKIRIASVVHRRTHPMA